MLGDAEVLLMHRLAPSPLEPDAEWPILTGWTVAFIALLPAFAIPVVAALRGMAHRLAAMPLAGSVATILLGLATFVLGLGPVPVRCTWLTG